MQERSGSRCFHTELRRNRGWAGRIAFQCFFRSRWREAVQGDFDCRVGQDIKVHIAETINSKTAQVGDSFTGTLRSPLTTRSGETVIAAGAKVSGSVVSVQNRGRFKGAGVLAIELKEVDGHSVNATEYVVSKKGKGKRSAALIGGGAGGGALIGGLAGGKKGALLGGLLGGGAGTAGAAFTGNKPLIIPGNSTVVFELSQPLSITVER